MELKKNIQFNTISIKINFIKLSINIFDEIDINNVYKTPLYVAVEKGNVEIVRLLLSRNDININERSI